MMNLQTSLHFTAYCTQHVLVDVSVRRFLSTSLQMCGVYVTVLFILDGAVSFCCWHFQRFEWKWDYRNSSWLFSKFVDTATPVSWLTSLYCKPIICCLFIIYLLLLEHCEWFSIRKSIQPVKKLLQQFLKISSDTFKLSTHMVHEHKF